MKLKQNKQIIIIVVFLLFGIGFYSVYQSKNNQEVVSTIDPVLLPIKKALVELHEDKQFKQLSKEAKLEKTYEILEKLPPEYVKLKRQYQIAMSSLPSILFYGRVVDQHGQPVANASVGYTGTNAYLSAGGGFGGVTTDEEGYFVINTTGATLNLGGVGHPDIEYSHEQDSGAGRGIPQSSTKITKRFLSGEDNAGIYDNWQKYTEKENAYIIQAWRLGKYEGAKKGVMTARVLSDGRIYTLRFSEKNRSRQMVEGQKKGDFHISCTRPPIKTYKDRLDWSASIIPVNGGIQETDDVFLNVAPESGYQPAIEINMHVGNSDYKPGLTNQRYYFTTDNGKNYGSLYVSFRPFASIKQNECDVSISYKINSTGSRSLELKRQPTSKIEPNSPTQTEYALLK
jgi:hypothetical protein